MIQKYRAYWVSENKMLTHVQELGFDWDGNFETVETEHYECLHADEVILMQSTGLFDSSEPPKEIFEGDIIRLEVPNQSMCGTYEVRRANSGEWRIDNRTQGRRLYDSLNNITVIGNIHQHPHLLEEK